LFCTHICTLILFHNLCTIPLGDEMKKLKINTDIKRIDTITRTIRVSGTTFDKINSLAEKNKLSFNSVVNQILEYGLENIEE